MVLLSNSDDDFERLWNHAGGLNDADGVKHTQSAQDVAAAGNFRSTLVDNWTNTSFDSVHKHFF